MPSSLQGAHGVARWARSAAPRLLAGDVYRRVQTRVQPRRVDRVQAALDAAGDDDARYSVLDGAVPGGLSQLRAEVFAFCAHVRETVAPLRTIAEIGVESGATNAFLARMTPEVEFVAAIDVFIRNEPLIHALAPEHVELHTIWGDSHDARTRERLAQALRGRPVDLLFIDGDHSFRGVAQDFRDYAPLVRAGGIVAFHDIVPDEWLRTGRPTDANVGEVPYVWSLLRRHYRSREFVAAPAQDGRGIGALVYDPAVPVDFRPSA